MKIYEVWTGSCPNPRFKQSYSDIREYDGIIDNEVIGGSGLCIHKAYSLDEAKKTIDIWNEWCDGMYEVNFKEKI